ncbi:Protein of unknown function [Spirosomataceae bacterium TFI 002]|nr:Protein of unknown function [Spirosomataceae bacterium TFI 002]
MKKHLFSLLFLLALGANAQDFPGLDKSPMDASYYPHGSAHDITFAKTLKEKGEMMTKIKVVYSRPSANGREIFGNLVKYETPWRIGANETTEVTFYTPVQIGESIIAPGTYAMYLVTSPGKWTLKIHPEAGGWGVYNFDASKDLASVETKPEKAKETIEALSVVMYKAKTGNVHLKIGWGELFGEFPITLL